MRDDRFAYLVHLLGWGLPLLAAQFVAVIARHRRETPAILRAVLPPALLVTVWLVIGDHFAIAAGVWRFGAGKHLGVYLGQVPLEEVLFFLLTNLFVALGLVLLAGLAPRTKG